MTAFPQSSRQNSSFFLYFLVKDNLWAGNAVLKRYQIFLLNRWFLRKWQKLLKVNYHFVKKYFASLVPPPCKFLFYYYVLFINFEIFGIFYRIWAILIHLTLGVTLAFKGEITPLNFLNIQVLHKLGDWQCTKEIQKKL